MATERRKAGEPIVRRTHRHGSQRYEPYRRDSSSGSSSYSPFALMRQGLDEMDRWFSRLVGDRRRSSSSWSPPLEVFQRGRDLVVRLEVPGITRHDVTVEVGDDTLTISGERRSEQRDQEGLFWTERSYGSFSRTIPLPPGAIADSAKATFHDGVLEVVLQAPSAEARRGRRIDISGG